MVGYGSIGQRHARLLQQLGCPTAIVSRRTGQNQDPGREPHHDWSDDLDAALERFAPGYVVVANETSAHRRTLEAIAATGFSGSILMEKPLWSAPHPPLPDCAAQVWVGYNMRFDPVLAALRKALDGQRVIAAALRVGSYLPDWRPARDYRTTSSALHGAGGGVLRDLSHEIDYALWLFGSWRRATALGGRLSDLEIETEDCFAVLAETEGCPSLTLSLDYLDRRGERTARVQTRESTFRADFLAGTVTENDRIVAQLPPQPRDSQYLAMHQAILSGAPGPACTLQEGEAVVACIAIAEAAAAQGQWVRP